MGLRVVLDTDVVVAAFRSDHGASRQLLLAALGRKLQLLVSVPLLLEYEAVLTRPDQLEACGLTAREVERVLDDVASVATPVRFAFHWRPKLSDQNDDMVLETALNGGADFIVTFNRGDFELPGPGGKKFFGCPVLSPGAALAKVRSSRS